MKRFLTVIITAVMFLTSVPLQVFADVTYSVEISGICDYDRAQEIYEYVNELRVENGLSPIAYDHELVEACMQRGFEICVNYSHTRPDGTDRFALCSKMNGENITVGISTAAAAFEQWKNSEKHLANMLNERVRSMGVGCVYHNGKYFWVQGFSVSATNGMEKAAGAEERTATVTIKEDEIAMNLYSGNFLCDGSYKLPVPFGTSTQLTAEKVNISNNYKQFSAALAGTSFVWSSSNEQAATVSEDGLVTAVGVGETVITAELKGTDLVFTQPVKATAKMAAVNAESLADEPYTGEAVTPIPKLTLGDYELVKDVDYTVEYSDNTAVGTAKVLITGKGCVSGTKELTFNINRADLSDKITVSFDPDAVFDGKDIDSFIKNNVKMMYGEKELEYETDFILSSYSYSSKKLSAVNFKLTDPNFDYNGVYYNISSAFAPVLKNIVYKGEYESPKVAVYASRSDYINGAQPLTEGVHYTMTDLGTGELGKAQVRITGTGMYFGTFLLDYEVVSPQPGDINRDGKVTMLDYICMQRYLGGDTDEIDLETADINQDGKVNMKDYVLIQHILIS